MWEVLAVGAFTLAAALGGSYVQARGSQKVNERRDRGETQRQVRAERRELYARHAVGLEEVRKAVVQMRNASPERALFDPEDTVLTSAYQRAAENLGSAIQEYGQTHPPVMLAGSQDACDTAREAHALMRKLATSHQEARADGKRPGKPFYERWLEDWSASQEAFVRAVRAELGYDD